MQYHLRALPNAVRIEQDKIGETNVAIFDAETNQMLDFVLSFSLSVSRFESSLTLTMAAHEPVKPDIYRDDADIDLEVVQGILVARRAYIIQTMRVETYH